jgi:Protein of unknown function (DUF2950)
VIEDANEKSPLPDLDAGAALLHLHGQRSAGVQDGFALLAWPAEYRNSGVMTFIVNHGGTVFRKDLGDDTDQIAGQMTSFNGDKTRQKITDTELVK